LTDYEVFSSETVTVAPGLEELAILSTLLYADIFEYPLTFTEIYHYLIGRPTTPEALQAILASSAWLAARIALTEQGYFVIRDRTGLGPLREERRRHATALWGAARRWGGFIGGLPFVRMVAVTGALAMDNAPADDDIDLLIVTAPGRVWLTRALAVALVRVGRLCGVGLCPNYVLSQSALAQEQQNLFIAHDLAQMTPLVGHAVYAEMRAANLWAEAFLPHARQPLRSEPDLAPHGWRRTLKQLGERLLSGRLGDALEAWEQRRKTRKFSSAAQTPGSAAQLDADHVKGHFNDHGISVLRKFEERLARYLR
jgi:hypothetical protein